MKVIKIILVESKASRTADGCSVVSRKDKVSEPASVFIRRVN